MTTKTLTLTQDLFRGEALRERSSIRPEALAARAGRNPVMFVV